MRTPLQSLKYESDWDAFEVSWDFQRHSLLRPIYWLYDSGKQNGFKALAYLHRYDADTSGRVRANYLHRMKKAYESEIGRHYQYGFGCLRSID